VVAAEMGPAHHLKRPERHISMTYDGTLIRPSVPPGNCVCRSVGQERLWAGQGRQVEGAFSSHVTSYKSYGHNIALLRGYVPPMHVHHVHGTCLKSAQRVCSLPWHKLCATEC
jgi:hypothetical protein